MFVIGSYQLNSYLPRFKLQAIQKMGNRVFHEYPYPSYPLENNFVLKNIRIKCNQIKLSKDRNDNDLACHWWDHWPFWIYSMMYNISIGPFCVCLALHSCRIYEKEMHLNLLLRKEARRIIKEME